MLKKCIAILLVHVSLISLTCQATDASVDIDTLPPLVYVLFVNGDDHTTEQHDLFSVKRNKEEFDAVFKSRESVDKFIQSLPAETAKTLKPMQMARSALASGIEHGLHPLLDPVSLTESGFTITKVSGSTKPAADNVALSQIYLDDQADRQPPDGQSINWKIVTPRDDDRKMRVMKFFKDGNIITGLDFYHAAMILHHAGSTADVLLAHDFCVTAIAKGVNDAKWLAAASEDRFLISIGHKQRFGTQLGLPLETDGVLTDQMRRTLNVPDLDESIAQSKSSGEH
jgi:hypothetical protein